jgi:hypothetical protein
MIAAIMAIPRYRLYAYGAILLFSLTYSGWSLWGPLPQEHSEGFVAAKPAVSADKVQGPTIPVQIVPKTAVKKKFPGAKIEGGTIEVIDTADIGKAPNGATTITVIDTITGESRTDVQMKDSPWFGFERQNYLGVGYELGTSGTQKAKVYYKRDLLRIKDIHLQGGAEVKAPINGSSGGVEATMYGNIEYRF